MRPIIQWVSILGILSLSLAGCGEKRLHVSTVSGTPGEKSSAASNANTAGLPGSSVDESSLTGQGAPPEQVLADAGQPVEPLNADVPTIPGQTDESLTKEPLSQSTTGSSSQGGSGSALVGDSGSSTPLANGNDISAQSSSSLMNGALPDHAGTFPLTDPADFESIPQIDMEPIPEGVQVAKAEPSDMLRQQLEKIQEEELATASAGLEDVFFQFDSWSLTAEAKESLERDLEWLIKDPSSLLVIEGHADQRGTQAYNMVLGKRRAMAIRDYLSQLGVDRSRLSVISYGKDKPFCQEPTEVCHQLNRRGHLLVQN